MAYVSGSLQRSMPAVHHKSTTIPIALDMACYAGIMSNPCTRTTASHVGNRS